MSQTLSTDSAPHFGVSPDPSLTSPAEIFAKLPPHDQHSLLASLAADAGLTLEEIQVELAYRWEGWQARPSQLAPPGDWLYWLLQAGRGYGKTRIGAEKTRGWARQVPIIHLIAPTPADYRDVMIEGESGIQAISPRHERPKFFPSKRLLVWPNGCKALCFSAEDPESLRGPQCYKLWADELAAWQYPQETWDMALLGLRLGEFPQAVVTSTPKPIGVYRDLVNDPDCVVTGGSTYENLANLGRPYRTIIRRYEGTNLGRQELLAELLEDEGLAYRFSERLHVVAPFEIPDDFDRFEQMDYGLSAATAWYPVAVDFDGNLIIFDGYYKGGLPSVVAPEIRRRRAESWEAVRNRKRVANICHADPAVFAGGKQTEWGRERSVADMYQDEGIALVRGDSDKNARVAGFVRISELLAPKDDRLFPEWHPRAGEPGAPQLYIVNVPGTQELREQLQDAPLEEDGKPHPGEAVDRDWERKKGHAHAALRYGVNRVIRPSKRPRVPDVLAPAGDPQALRAEHFARVEKRRNKPATAKKSWRNV
jgi:hypothetical protein